MIPVRIDDRKALASPTRATSETHITQGKLRLSEDGTCPRCGRVWGALFHERLDLVRLSRLPVHEWEQVLLCWVGTCGGRP